MQQASPMKPKIRLNFSYTGNSQPQHHYPSPNQKNTQQNFYLPLHLLQHSKCVPHTEYHQTIRNNQSSYEEEAFRKHGKGLALTSSTKPFTNRSLEQHRHVTQHQYPNYTQTARDCNGENGLLRSNFSDLRIKLTQAQREKGMQGTSFTERTMMTNSTYHSALNLQNAHTPKNIKMRLRNQNQNNASNNFFRQNDVLNADSVEEDDFKRLKTQNLDLMESNHFDGLSKSQQNLVMTQVSDKSVKNSEYICGLLSQIKDLEGQKKKLSAEIQEKDRKISILSEQNEQKDSALDQAARRISEMNDSSEGRNEEIQGWKNKADQLENYLQKAEHEINRLNQAIQHDPRLAGLQRQYSALKEKTAYFEGKATSLEEQLSKMNTSVAELKGKMQRALKDVYLQVQVVDNFRTKYQELEEMKTIYAEKSQKKPEQMSAQKKKILSQFAILKRQNESFRITQTASQQAMTKKQKQLYDLRQEKAFSAAKIRQLNQQLSSKEHQLSVLLGEISQLRGERESS